MPAKTVSQLEGILGSYVVPDSTFTAALEQVLPRVYSMGLWRDLAYEVSLDGSNGYISLPDDTDSVLAVTVNDHPRMARSMWHDVRISGRNATLSSYYGIVDLGYFPVMWDFETTQGVATADLVPQYLFTLYPAGTTSAPEAFAGSITLIGRSADGVTVSGEAVLDTDLLIDLDQGSVTSVTSIQYNDITQPLDLHDDHGLIATIPTGSGVLRYRRFRTSETTPTCTVHLLVKRSCPSDLTDSTVIYLSNLGAIKHGLLGLIAEDNADLDRADRHWKECGKLLDEELLSIMGSAKPTLTLDLSGGHSAPPIHNLR